MPGDSVQAQSLGEFVDLIARCSPPRWIFRGQSGRDRPLIPLLLRPGIRQGHASSEAFERELLAQFQREAWPHLEPVASQLGDWEWLAIAQHHGLPTRLLDWTHNAGAALFFCVENPEILEDGVVFCLRFPSPQRLPDEPFGLRSVFVYEPPHVVRRFITQRGCFTAHPDDFDERSKWPGELVRVTIPCARRAEIREQLRMLGIDRASLFPGLDGVAACIRARYRTIGPAAAGTAIRPTSVQPRRRRRLD